MTLDLLSGRIQPSKITVGVCLCLNQYVVQVRAFPSKYVFQYSLFIFNIVTLTQNYILISYVMGLFYVYYNTVL